MQKDLKIVAMIFHIAPCRIRDRKDHRSDNRWRHCGSVLYFCPEIWTLCISALCKSVLARLPPCVAAGLVRYQRCAARGGGPQVPGSSPGPRPVSRPAHRRHQLPPPSGDQPGQCCPDPRRVQTHAVSSGHTVTLLYTQLRFISLPCTNLLRSACDSLGLDESTNH